MSRGDGYSSRFGSPIWVRTGRFLRSIVSGLVSSKPTACGRATLIGSADPAVRIHRELLHERRMTGLHFWAKGYWVSTAGRDEETVRQYIREQEHWDHGQGQLFD